MAINQIIKKTDSVITYGFNWTDWLSGFNDTISSVDWAGTSAQIVYSNTSHTTTWAYIRLAGLQDSGTVGTEYEVVCTITTAGGLVRAKAVPVFYRQGVPNYWVSLQTQSGVANIS
jgi:hypothetical protein